MKKPFYFSFQFKVILILLILINLPFLFVAKLGMNLVESTLLQEKENKLVALSRTLDSLLDAGGYTAILRQHNAEHASREEKITVLNAALHKLTDKLVDTSEGLAIGYYSADLSAILVYAPSDKYGHTVGLSISPEHPGNTVMRKNKPIVSHGSMIRGEIMNSMQPLERNGVVIGYAWANELETDISTQLASLTRETEIILLGCLTVTILFLSLLSRRTLRDINSIIKGVHAIQKDISHRMPTLKGDLGEVVSSINEMAESLNSAQKKTERAISTFQSVISNLEVAILVCDPRTMRLVYVNPYVHKLWQVKDTDNKICYNVLYGLTEPCKNCPQGGLFDKDGSPNFDILYREEFNEHLQRDLLLADRLISWHDGKIVHLRVITDVTDRKALMAAETANKAQRDFLARMSHEIRSPMNGVLGMTRLAIQENPPPKQLEYLNKIQSSASLLLGIINDILVEP